ncbi:MAG: gamma-hexachlorocyclohexane dehydrochlorinase [Rhodospirillales bacterium]|nr:gamma-hexachlorocyclohexane dehydrochlorinase [Rhodospirillales bacterium]
MIDHADPVIRDLLARQALSESREVIRECLYRYCRGIDRADAAVLRSAYWPDAIDDHVLFNGNAYDFIDWCVPLLAQVEHSQHMLGNILIEIDGDEARAETYYHAYERRRRASGYPYEMFVGGRYLDRFERRDGEWRIIHRLVMWDWFRHFKDSADLDKGVFGKGPVRMSGKYPDDPSYAPFGQN